MYEAIVLAGGRGTRLQGVIKNVPKPMAPIGETPFLEIVIKMLIQKGFGHIIFSVGYMADIIMRHFGTCFDEIQISYAVEDIPLGTGGALRLAMQQSTMDHVFVFNGDTFLDLDVEQAEADWQNYHIPIIVGRQVPDVSRYGALEESDGYITKFLEKSENPQPGIVNAGCYIFPHSFLDDFPCNLPFSLENDVIIPSVTNKPFKLFITDGIFIDIGVPKDYERALKLLGAIKKYVG